MPLGNGIFSQVTREKKRNHKTVTSKSQSQDALSPLGEMPSDNGVFSQVTREKKKEITKLQVSNLKSQIFNLQLLFLNSKIIILN
jgi:hypothetical protein